MDWLYCNIWQWIYDGWCINWSKEWWRCLLINNSLIAAALYLRIHNQIIFSCGSNTKAPSSHQPQWFRSHLIPQHQHRWESLTDVLFLPYGHYLIAIKPVSAFNIMPVISSDSSLRVFPLSFSMRSYSSSSDYPLRCVTNWRVVVMYASGKRIPPNHTP